MVFTPTNPTEIPRNNEYKASVEKNPFSIWTLGTSVGDDPEFMKVEKDLFKEICRLLEVSWIEINKKSLWEKTNVLAKFIYKKIAENEYNFLKDPTTLANFQTKVNDAYLKLVSSSPSPSASSEKAQADDIIHSITDAISNCIRMMDADATSQIRAIRDELFLDYLSRDSIKKIVENNQHLAALPYLSSTSQTNVTNVSADVLDDMISKEVEFNILEDEEDANIFEEQMEIVQQALKDGGPNTIQEKVKELSREKANYANLRLLTYDRLKTYYHNLNSLSENRRKTRIGRFLAKPINFMKAFGGERGTQLLADKFKNETIGDSLFRVPMIRRLVSGSDADKKKFLSDMRKLPVMNKLMNIKSAHLILVPAKILLTYTLTFEILAFKALSVAKKGFVKGFSVLGKLISKVGNSLYEFFKNPINAFKASMVISFTLRIFTRSKNGKLKKLLKRVWSFGKIIILKLGKYITDKAKKFWENLEKQYPILKQGRDFLGWLNQKIQNSWVFKTVKFTVDSLRSFAHGLYMENKVGFESRKAEFKKQGIDYTLFDYLLDPDGMLDNSLKATKAWWDLWWKDSTFGKLMSSLVKITSFVASSVYSYIIKPIASMVIPLIQFASKGPIARILETLYDLFTSPAGMIAQIAGSAFGPIGLLLAIGAFIVGDLFYRAIQRKDKNALYIKEKYENLYNINLDDDKDKIVKKYTTDAEGSRLNEYLNSLNLPKDEKEKRKKELQEKFTKFFGNVLEEVSVLDNLMEKISNYGQLLEDNRTGMNFKDIPEGVLNNIFYSDLLGTEFSKWKNQFSGSTAHIKDSKKLYTWQFNFLRNFIGLRQGLLDSAILQPILKEDFSWGNIVSLMDNLDKIGNQINDSINLPNVSDDIDYKNIGGDSAIKKRAIQDVFNHVFSGDSIGFLKDKHAEVDVTNFVNGRLTWRLFGSNKFMGTTTIKAGSKSGGIGPTLESITPKVKGQQVEKLYNLVDSMTSSPELSEKYWGIRFSNAQKEELGRKLREKINVGNLESLLKKHGSWEEFIKEEIVKEIFPEQQYSGKIPYDKMIGTIFDDMYTYYEYSESDKKLAELVTTVKGLCDVIDVNVPEDFDFTETKKRIETCENYARDAARNMKKFEEKAEKIDPYFNGRILPDGLRTPPVTIPGLQNPMYGKPSLGKYPTRSFITIPGVGY